MKNEDLFEELKKINQKISIIKGKIATAKGHRLGDQIVFESEKDVTQYKAISEEVQKLEVRKRELKAQIKESQSNNPD